MALLSPDPDSDPVQRAIQGMGHRCGCNNKKMVQKILCHARHCLRHLRANIASLECAMECMKAKDNNNNNNVISQWMRAFVLVSTSSASSSTCGTPTVSASRTTKIHEHLDHVLQFVFTTLLRFHDGLIYISSGECRHGVDMQSAQNTAFPSHLTRQRSTSSSMQPQQQQQKQKKDQKGGDGDGDGDGYTTLYKKDLIYNGTSWDEWNDPVNGIQKRLVNATKMSWMSLAKGTGVNSIVNALEAQIRALEDDFGALKRRIESALVEPLVRVLRTSHVQVALSFRDKMETLTIRAPPSVQYNRVFQRLGSQFQLTHSVLPIAHKEEWMRLLTYEPPQHTGKKSLDSSLAKRTAHNANNSTLNPNPNAKKRNHCHPTILDDATSDDDDNNNNNSNAYARKETEASTSSSLMTTTVITATGLIVQKKSHHCSPCPSSAALCVDSNSTGITKKQHPNHNDPSADSALRAQHNSSNSNSNSKSNNNSPTHNDCSINAIKIAMGVNVHALESSHGLLQEEEDMARREAQRVDDDKDEENHEFQYKVLLKQLHRAMRNDHFTSSASSLFINQEQQDDMIWELRDSVRQSAMAAGNQNLWNTTRDADHAVSSHSQQATIEQRKNHRAALERALYFFLQAQKLVEDQEKLHQRMIVRQRSDALSLSSSSLSDMAKLFQRNLFLLKGQAHVNAGASLVELVRIKCKTSWIEQAMEQIGAAQTCANAMHALATSDGHTSSIDAELDCLKSQELGLLAERWRGILLWIQGEHIQATQLLQEIASMELITTQANTKENELVEANMKVLAESYLAAASLAEFALHALVITPLSKARQDFGLCTDLWNTFENAIESAVTRSRELHSLVANRQSSWLFHESLLDEYGIQPDCELQNYLQEMKDWWFKRKALSQRPIDTKEKLDNVAGNVLSEKFRLLQRSVDQAAHSRRFAVYGTSSFLSNRRRREKVSGNGNTNVQYSVVNRPPPVSSQPECRKFRRWGDDLLPQVMDENGRMVPKLCYPTLPPEMPPEMIARYNAQLASKARNIDNCQ